MTIQEFIDELNKFQDKSLGVLIESGFTPVGKNEISAVERIPTRKYVVVLCRP